MLQSFVPQAFLRRVALYADVTQALGRTAFRRARGARSHESWSLAYELAMTALNVAARRHYPLASALARVQVAPLPRALVGRVAITTGTLAGLPVEIHTPSGFTASGPTLLYLHGGGYVTCSPASHRDVIARIADAARVRCVAPDYRLAPAHPFPAALSDAVASYRALAAEAAGSPMFVAGDSAGGGLTLALLLRLRAAGDPLPRACVLLSPWVDLSIEAAALRDRAPRDYLEGRRLHENARDYAGAHALDDPLVSPVFADLRGLPPIMLHTGSWELLHEQCERLATRARAAGVAVDHRAEPGMLHAFTCFAGVSPAGRRAIAATGAFLRAIAREPAEAREQADR